MMSMQLFRREPAARGGQEGDICRSPLHNTTVENAELDALITAWATVIRTIALRELG